MFGHGMIQTWASHWTNHYLGNEASWWLSHKSPYHLINGNQSVWRNPRMSHQKNEANGAKHKQESLLIPFFKVLSFQWHKFNLMTLPTAFHPKVCVKPKQTLLTLLIFTFQTQFRRLTAPCTLYLIKNFLSEYVHKSTLIKYVSNTRTIRKLKQMEQNISNWAL